MFSLASSPAQTQRDWWYTLERGKHIFRQGDYGNALLAFEDARRQRRDLFSEKERNLIEFLSLGEVRRLGDSLDWIEQFIGERGFESTAEIFQDLYSRIPRDTFNNSATAALEALGALKDYPEAEYWIGEVYFSEGELSLALSQFQKTLTMSDRLENPGYTTELQYKIADIHRIRQEFPEMEKVLLALLDTDSLWSTEAKTGSESSFVRQAMTRTLENSGINRFLTLYRYTSQSVRAHRLLGIYYYASGRHSRAQEHLMFAFLIQSTAIIDEIISHQFDFEFTTLEALSDEIRNSPLLMEFASQNEYYRTAYYLGASLYANGKTSTARDIWNFLAAHSSSGEWQARAQGQLNSPHVEQALEMP